VIIEKQKAFSKIIILLLLFFVFLFTRFYNLSEAPVWEDNFSWLYRINYYPWIIENNLKGNPEEGKDLSYAGKISYHPGVTLMTFSGFTTRYGKKIISKIDTEYKPCAYNDYECPYLNVELLLAKIPIIFISSIAFFIIIYILSNNISLLSALIFGVIVLFEPIFVTTSRDLHLDFLQSILITLSFVIFIFYSKQKELVFSGISFGLATLTRFISVMFVPSFLFIEVIFRKFEIKKVLLLFFSSFLDSVASGSLKLTFRSTSRITVVAIKKNKSIKTISGNEAVLMAPVSFFSPFLNLDILFSSSDIFRFRFRNRSRIIFFYSILLVLIQSIVFF